MSTRQDDFSEKAVNLRKDGYREFARGLPGVQRVTDRAPVHPIVENFVEKGAWVKCYPRVLIEDREVREMHNHSLIHVTAFEARGSAK